MDKKKVLLVDDEEGFRKLIGTRIRNWGYDLIETANGKEAIEAVMNKGIEIVILDYKMPEMDGVEALEQIREINKKIPVIMFTAYPDEKSIKGTEKLGVSFYVPKLSVYSDAYANLKLAIDMIEKKLSKKYQ